MATLIRLEAVISSNMRPSGLIKKHPAVFLWQPGRDMGSQHVVPAIERDEAVAGGEIAAEPRFFFADPTGKQPVSSLRECHAHGLPSRGN